MPRSTHRSTRWPSQITLRGLLALRMWMVLVVAMLGLGTGTRPTAVAPTQVAEQGLRSSPTGPSSPGELPEEELPLRGENEAEDAKDAKDAKDSEDSERRRAPDSVLSLAPELELRLVASASFHRYGIANIGCSTQAHRSQLHNRGPPLA